MAENLLDNRRLYSILYLENLELDDKTSDEDLEKQTANLAMRHSKMVRIFLEVLLPGADEDELECIMSDKVRECRGDVQCTGVDVMSSLFFNTRSFLLSPPDLCNDSPTPKRENPFLSLTSNPCPSTHF